MKALYWLGQAPKTCDVCVGTIDKQFIDGKTLRGPWACMCPSCHKNVGVGLGTGRGQRYEQQEDGRYLKIEG